MPLLRDWAVLPDSFMNQIKKKFEMIFSNMLSEVNSNNK